METTSDGAEPRNGLPTEQEVQNLLHAFLDSDILMMGVVELLDDDILHIQDQHATVVFFGVTAEATRNRTARELGVPPDIVALWLEHYREADRTGQPIRFEYQHPTKAGPRCLAVRVARLTGTGDNPRQFGYVIEDVTEQRALAESAEEARRDHAVENRAVTILESISDAYFSVDRSWRFTYVNREAERILKTPRSNLLGRNLWDVYADAEELPFGVEYHRAMEEHVQVEFEAYYPPLAAWYTVRAHPVEDGLAVYFRDTTRTREADAAIRQNQDFFQLLDEAVPDLIWVTDTDYSPLYLNRRWHEYTGLTLEKVVQTGYLLLYHPDDREKVERLWEESRASGQPFVSEVRYRRHDGEYRWFWRRGVPIKDQAGRVVRWVGVSTELTERKELEETLRQKHAETERERRRLRAVLDVLPVAVFLCDPAGKVLEYNEAGKSIWGAGSPLSDSAEEYGEDYVGWWPKTGKRLEAHEWATSRVLDTGEPVIAEEVEIQSRDGKRKTILNYSLPIRNDAGAIDGGVTVNVDITDRKQMEETLRHSEEQLRLAVEGGRLATFILNPLTDEVLFQNNVHTLFGLPEPVKSVPDLRAVIHADDLERVRAAFRQCVEIGSSLDVEFRVVLPDGSIRWLEAMGHPYILGEVNVVAGIHLDITERKHQEQTLQEHAEALKAADRAKDEFLAMLGHELRNPLGAISNATQLLRMRAQEADGFQRPVDILGRQVEHMTRLVEDLLEVSRITMGRMELRREPVDLVQVIRHETEAIQPLMDRNRHEHTVSLPEAPLWLEGDTARLQQVVGNLLNNAAKYTPPGGRIRVSLDEENGEAVLRVRDNGQGVSAELLPHIFDLFTQAETTLDRPHGGLGIGLALVKRIVELHGGSVSAHSGGPGLGSEFTVRLPLPSGPSLSPSEDGDAAAAPSGTALHILIVEDHSDAAAALVDLLELDGHTAEVVGDGQAALEYLEACRPDVVLLDIGLPKMDGYEVARQIRLLESMRNVPIIAMTGYGQEQDRDQALEAGMQAHLTKPVAFHRLRALLGEYAQRAVIDGG